MARIPGAKNIVAFEDRTNVATTTVQSVSHLSTQADSTPLEQFNALVRHQTNYLKWLDTRHSELAEAKKELDPNGRGPKDATYRKYRWYADQNALLEAINGFEVFYKNTFIALGTALRRYVPPSSIKGSVESRVLWTSQGKTSFTAFIFEQQLYHNLEQVDEVANMLVGKRRYMPNNLQSQIRQRVLALQAVFQLRHTLSHNQGRVTQSDRTKLLALGYDAANGEILDPSKDNLGKSVRDLLLLEADAFTTWILEQSAVFLDARRQTDGIELKRALRNKIRKLVGTVSELDNLNWT